MLGWVTIELSPPAPRANVELVPPTAVELGNVAVAPPVLLVTEVLPLFESDDFPPHPENATALASVATNKENVQVRISGIAPGSLDWPRGYSQSVYVAARVF